jgi:hypothetical protein
MTNPNISGPPADNDASNSKLIGSLLGLPTADINPSGPIVGMFGVYGSIIDGFGFYTDTCYCYRSTILPWTVQTPYSIQLGQIGRPTITWTNTG